MFKIGVLQQFHTEQVTVQGRKEPICSVLQVSSHVKYPLPDWRLTNFTALAQNARPRSPKATLSAINVHTSLTVSALLISDDVMLMLSMLLMLIVQTVCAICGKANKKTTGTAPVVSGQKRSLK